MNFNVVKQDLFTVDFDVWTPAHCIASDCGMGAGIAVPMKKKFNLHHLESFSDGFRMHPTCIHFNHVFNLITKKYSSGKPTYNNLFCAVYDMKEQALKFGIKHIVMPKIGCGLDGLNWSSVEHNIKIIFDETDIKIGVCYL